MKAIPAVVVLSATLLGGCAGFGSPNLTPEQLKAAATDKSASVGCGTGTGPWGKVNTVYVNVDKASVKNGVVTVDAECKVSISTSDPQPKPVTP